MFLQAFFEILSFWLQIYKFCIKVDPFLLDQYLLVLTVAVLFKVLCYLESMFCKVDTCLQKNETCIGSMAEQIFSVNIWYTYFSILGVAFTVPFLCYFQKLQLLVVKKFWTNFCCIVLLYLWAQKVCLITNWRYINIFVLRGVFFRGYVILKSSFSDEKNISGEIWDTLL